MRTDDLDYHLPPERIAQAPPAKRADARLLVVPRAVGDLAHRSIRDLPTLLEPGDLIVVNDTRVLPARVYALRDTGGRVEILFLEPVGDDAAGPWQALLRSGGRPQPGEQLSLNADVLIELRERRSDGTWLVATTGATPEAVMEAHGIMPLPPYIRRQQADERGAMDLERYQTVYAAEAGAVAAPTAGLHLSDELLAALAERGVQLARVTLHVGRGTFDPIRADDLDAHDMHSERYSIPDVTVQAVRRTKAAGGRVVAIGTTSVRALEAAAQDADDGLPVAGAGSTRLLIQPGYTFRVVDALLTNFHLPRSTLLALVYALADRDRIRAAYDAAIEAEYRFYSYGDAMLIA